MSDLVRRETTPAPVVYEQPQNIWLDDYLDGKEVKYVQIVLKRKWLILGVTLLGLVAAAGWTYTTKPLYRSTARIQIDPVQTVLPYKEIEMFDAYGNVETQAEVLKSEVLARRVVGRLNLATNPDQVTRAATRFISRLAVSQVERTQVLKVSFLSEEPQLAAQAVNALAAEYVDYSFDSKREATDKAREFLEKELLAMKPRLERSEAQLVKYAREHGMLDEKNNVVLQKVGDLNQEMTKVETQVLSNQYEVVQGGRSGEFPESLKTTAMKDLEHRRLSLEQSRADLAVGFGPKWPEVIALDEQIADVKRQLDSETKKALEQVKLEYDLAQAHRQRVAAALANQNRLADQNIQDSIQYNVLKREVETDRQLRDGLLQRLKETGVSEGFRSANIHVIDRGQVPVNPDSPSVPRNLGLGLALGLVTGFMMACFSEFIDRTVKTAEDVEQVLGLPFLAMIPAFEKSWKQATGGLLVQGAGRSSEHALVPFVHASSHPYWESYRSLRTSLLLSSPDRQPQTILVTSAMSNEGKSTTAVNLGITLAQTGARTLILDLDMRRPSLAHTFHLPRTTGISRYLSSQSELHTEILQTGIPNLFILPAGPTLPNPPELIGSKRMELALHLLAGHFDYIVIDSPPLMAVTDPLVIAAQVDGVLLVVQAGKTPKAAVQKARNLLRTVDAKILGAVITGAKPANPGYYQAGAYLHGST
jgi:succinoglycan biosynthesis transport protein ExoP